MLRKIKRKFLLIQQADDLRHHNLLTTRKNTQPLFFLVAPSGWTCRRHFGPSFRPLVVIAGLSPCYRNAFAAISIYGRKGAGLGFGLSTWTPSVDTSRKLSFVFRSFGCRRSGDSQWLTGMWSRDKISTNEKPSFRCQNKPVETNRQKSWISMTTIL